MSDMSTSTLKLIYESAIMRAYEVEEHFPAEENRRPEPASPSRDTRELVVEMRDIADGTWHQVASFVVSIHDADGPNRQRHIATTPPYFLVRLQQFQNAMNEWFELRN
jgi:hypothetical protein